MTGFATGPIAAAVGGALIFWLGSGLPGGAGPTAAAMGPLAPDSLPSVEELARSFEAGDPAEGRAGIRLRAAAAGPVRGTLWVQLLAVVARVGPEVASAAVRAVGMAWEGEGSAAADLLEAEAAEAPAADGPALLQLAAILAEADDLARAAELWRRILEEHPDSYEAPEAALREARRLLGTEEGRAEGLALLEELIVGAPAHPIAPQARRLFEIERARAPSQDVLPGGTRR